MRLLKMMAAASYKTFDTYVLKLQAVMSQTNLMSVQQQREPSFPNCLANAVKTVAKV